MDILHYTSGDIVSVCLIVDEKCLLFRFPLKVTNSILVINLAQDIYSVYWSLIINRPKCFKLIKQCYTSTLENSVPVTIICTEYELNKFKVHKIKVKLIHTYVIEFCHFAGTALAKW